MTPFEENIAKAKRKNLLACRKCGTDVNHPTTAGVLPGTTCFHASSFVVGQMESQKTSSCYYCADCAPIVDDALQEHGLLVVPAPSSKKTLSEARAEVLNLPPGNYFVHVRPDRSSEILPAPSRRNGR